MAWRSDAEALAELGGLLRPGPTFRVVLPDQSTRLMTLDAITANIDTLCTALDEEMTLSSDTVMSEMCTQASGVAIDVHIRCGEQLYAVQFTPDREITFHMTDNITPFSSLADLVAAVANKIKAHFQLKCDTETLCARALDAVALESETTPPPGCAAAAPFAAAPSAAAPSAAAAAAGPAAGPAIAM